MKKIVYVCLLVTILGFSSCQTRLPNEPNIVPVEYSQPKT